MPTSSCCRRSRRAWAWRSRTRGCSTRRSACWPRPSSARRAGGHQRDRRGAREAARLPGDIDAGRRQDPRDLRCHDRDHRPLRPRRPRPDRLPVRDRRWAAHRRRPTESAEWTDRDRHRDARAAPAQHDRRGRERPAARPSSDGRRRRVVAGRADPRRRTRARACIALERMTDERASARPTSGCCRRSPRAWASRSRTRGCSTRRKRLLTETNERAAELAIINSVQEGLAAKLDMQAMYDLVGDKIQEIFDAQVVDIGLYDLEAGLIALPVRDRARRALPDEPTPTTRLRRERSSRRGSPGRDQRRRGWMEPRRRHAVVDPGRASQVGRCSRRCIVGDEVFGRHLAPEHRPHECLQRGRRAPADDARRRA